MDKQKAEEMIEAAVDAMNAFNDKMKDLGSAGIISTLASITMKKEGDQLNAVVNTPVEYTLKGIMRCIEAGERFDREADVEFIRVCVLPTCLMLATAFKSVGARYEEHIGKILEALEDSPQAEPEPELADGEGAESQPAEEEQNDADLGGRVERLPAQEPGAVAG